MSFNCFTMLTIKGDPTSLKEFKVKAQGQDTNLSLVKLHDKPKHLDTEWWLEKQFGLTHELFTVEEEHTEKELNYGFETYDEPPFTWLKEISKAYPHLEFAIRYYDDNEDEDNEEDRVCEVQARNGVLGQPIEVDINKDNEPRN
ncbi:hypothetical protein [Candidatus Leptofilum sp.]|uniref:hypothetical protein n=1 Tax=Candidatus Leptofilum sp. TaxID=3241576 RepID=UPI003B5A52B3